MSYRAALFMVLITAVRLTPNLPPRSIPRLRNRHDRIFPHGTHTKVRVTRNDSVPQIAHRYSRRHVNCRNARRTQTIRDYNVRRPSARTQAERRSHQEGGH